MRLEIEALSHRFAGADHAVLAPLDHRFAEGALTMITGPSGSGKSTLLSLLALMLTASEGKVRWDDHDVQVLSDHERTRLRALHAGFVFQDALLDLSRTARDNVLEAAALAGMSFAAARPRARELFERFGVGELADRRPGQISGGQAQRIALCRALVKHPSVVFADEPTGNLDPTSAGIVWDALASAAEDGATVIVATHDVERARRAKHHLELSVAA